MKKIEITEDHKRLGEGFTGGTIAAFETSNSKELVQTHIAYSCGDEKWVTEEWYFDGKLIKKNDGHTTHFGAQEFGTLEEFTKSQDISEGIHDEIELAFHENSIPEKSFWGLLDKISKDA
jgi:hypothetical protein